MTTHNFIAAAELISSILSSSILYNAMYTVGIFQCIHLWTYILGYVVRRLVIIIMRGRGEVIQYSSWLGSLKTFICCFSGHHAMCAPANINAGPVNVTEVAIVSSERLPMEDQFETERHGTKRCRSTIQRAGI